MRVKPATTIEVWWSDIRVAEFTELYYAELFKEAMEKKEPYKYWHIEERQ